jgi:hypothetical protein
VLVGMVYNINMITLQYLIDKGYSAEELAPEIFLVKDFLNEKEIVDLFSIAH